MSVHGNFSELTFVNATTPAINAVNLNAIESTLKIADTELARSLSFSWEYYKDMFFNSSQKTINRFLDYTDWSGTNGPTISEAGHSTVLLHGRGVKMLQPTNDAEELAIFDSSHTSQNLERFEAYGHISKDESSTDDLICLLCYISDTTYITRISFRFGNDTSDYYYYDHSVGLVNGWNIICIPKSSFTANGAIANWQTIEYVAYRALFAASAMNEYVIFNHCALVRVDGTTSTLMNPFVANNYSGDWDTEIMTPNSQFLIYKDAQFEEICVLSCLADGVLASSPDFLGSGLVCSSFTATFRLIPRATDYTQGIMWYIDDDNYLLFHFDASDVQVSKRLAGASTMYYKSYIGSLVIGSTLLIRIEKIGGDIVRIFVTDESGSNEFIEVSGTAAAFSDTDEGEVGIGAYSTTHKSVIQDFVVTNRTTDNIKLSEMANKNNNAYQYIKKEADEYRTTTTTISDDNDFNIRLAPYGLYKVTARLIVSAATDVPDFKSAWSKSTDVTAETYKTMIGPSTSTSNVASTSVRSSSFAIDAEANYGCDGSNNSQIHEEFIVSTGNTGGRLKLQWSQNTSSIASTLLHEESYMIVEKINDNF